MAEVARVAIETPLPHLDRLFDFAIPEELDSSALPGCRVKKCGSTDVRSPVGSSNEAKESSPARCSHCSRSPVRRC